MTTTALGLGPRRSTGLRDQELRRIAGYIGAEMGKERRMKTLLRFIRWFGKELVNSHHSFEVFPTVAGDYSPSALSTIHCREMDR